MALGSRASAVEVDLSSIKGLQSLEGSTMMLGSGPSASAAVSTAPNAGVSITNGMVAP